MKARSVIVWVVAACALAACQEAPESTRACTAIGAESGVSIDLRARPALDTGGLEVCVSGACHPAQPGRDHVRWVPVASMRSTAQVPVEVRDHGKAVLRTTVTPATNEPNGPGCPPIAYQATVTVPPARP